MNFIWCMVLTIIGGTMLIKPKAIWIIAESWKIKTKAEPTTLYLILIQIGGCILAVGSILAIFQMK